MVIDIHNNHIYNLKLRHVYLQSNLHYGQLNSISKTRHILHTLDSMNFL